MVLSHCRLAWIRLNFIHLWFTITIIVGSELAAVLILVLHNRTILWISLNFKNWETLIFIYSNDLFIYSFFFTLIIRILWLGLIVMQIIDMLILVYNRLFRVLFILLIFLFRIDNDSCIRINFASWRSSSLTKGCRSNLINGIWRNNQYRDGYFTLLLLVF